MNIIESLNYGFEKKYHLRESKEDKEKFLSFAGQDLFDRFELLKSKQIIKGQDADYTYWEKKSLQDLKNFIINAEKSQEEKNAKKQKVSSAYKARDEMTKNLQAGKDFEIIYQGEGWTVYHILTYEASASLGDGSTWCISGLYPKQEGPKKGRFYFNDYLENKGIKGYYFLLPDTDFKDNKYAYTYMGTDLTLRDKWFWDNKDDPHTIENVNIPNDVLLSLPGISKKTFDDMQEKKDRKSKQKELIAEVQKTGIYTYNSLDNNSFIQKLNPKKVVVPNGVTQIGEDAFSHCTSLKEITIPNSVMQIGDSAFYYCTSLQEITIPNSVTQIGDSVFNGCESLQQITIPNGVTKIGEDTFRYCISLQQINIPNSVTKIGNYAFYYCISLQEITIPNSVTKIGDSAFYRCCAFYNCGGLQKITIKGEYRPQIFKYAELDKQVILNWVDCGIKEIWRDIKNKI